MENLVNQIQPTFEELASLIRSFSDEDFNRVPFERSWTAGQVAEHIRLSVKGLPKLFTAATRESERPASEKVQQIADVFLNFETKFDSPEFILPEPKRYDKEIFAAFFIDYACELKNLCEELDMSRICVGFEVPGFGPMTRLEFVAFALFHTQRHMAQMQKIAQVLTQSPR